jgi:uncharacterized protein involved in exopolysaccharide biosynthesis
MDIPKKPYVALEDLRPNEAPVIKMEDLEQDSPELFLNTQLHLLQSQQIIQGVEQRIQGETRQRFMAPYVNALELSGPLSPLEILTHNRSVEHLPRSYIYQVYYKHPDPIIAAEITNLFMKEFIDFHLKGEIDGYMRVVEDLRIRIERVDQQIEASAVALEKLKQASDNTESPELDKSTQELEALITFRTKLYTAITEAKARVNLANPIARIVDSAYPPFHHHSPKIQVQLNYTLAAALLAACTFFFVGNRVFA